MRSLSFTLSNVYGISWSISIMYIQIKVEFLGPPPYKIVDRLDTVQGILQYYIQKLTWIKAFSFCIRSELSGDCLSSYSSMASFGTASIFYFSYRPWPALDSNSRISCLKWRKGRVFNNALASQLVEKGQGKKLIKPHTWPFNKHKALESVRWIILTCE